MSVNTHIIRYAKYHYGKSDNRVDDLKYIVSKWCLLPYECVTDEDVLECVYDVWLQYADEHSQNMFMKEVFFSSEYHYKNGCKRGNSNVDTAVNVMLSGLFPVKGDKLPPLEEKYDVTFGGEVIEEQPKQMTSAELIESLKGDDSYVV